ncbi:MAG: nucleotidyltransferase family protein [Pseudomonadota bacterium]
MTPAERLYAGLADPQSLADLDAEAWNGVIRIARAEMLTGTLGTRSMGVEILPRARLFLDEAVATAQVRQAAARYELSKIAEAMRGTDIPVILLKGSAYLAAGLDAVAGRNIGDQDLLVPEADLNRAETALRAHGWQPAKAKGTYDDDYYRRWMHELPPMVHETRRAVVDLHHNILPRTARLTPRPDLMFAGRVEVEHGLFVLSPEMMLLHCATHLAYDGDFLGGPRNLWDMNRLVRTFAGNEGFWDRLQMAAAAHELTAPLMRALRLAAHLYDTPSPCALRGRTDIVDRLAIAKLYGHDAYGRQRRHGAAFALFVRGHWLRMPPLMLAQHLTTKWRARRREARAAGR